MYVDNESDAGSDTSTPGSVAGSIGSGKGSRGPGRRKCHAMSIRDQPDSIHKKYLRSE